MLKKLRLLLSLRAWLKSRTLNVSAILGAIVTADLTTGNDILMTAIEFVASAGGITSGTALAAVVAIRELVAVALRAKTERSLKDK